MIIKITNRYTGATIFETEASTLREANFRGANLRGADLSYADLRSANLSDADLRGANLRGAYLRGAYLRGANLSDADLRGANLRGAYLSDADLRSADLHNADLSDADIKKLLTTRTILADGVIIGWKKLADGSICKLKIPAEARRVGGVMGRKCRAEYAIVMSGNGRSRHASGFHYIEGEIVRPKRYDDNPLVECSHGIHFFITRDEAEAY